MMRGWFAPPVSLLVILFLALRFTNGNDTIHRGETITHPKTIISSNGTFELGFFSATSYSKYYLGIWHKVSKPARVRVANREYPSLSDSSNLTINSEGNLVISDGRMSYKVTDITTSNNSNTFARLLDSGNLVLLDGISSAVLWQSFDFPTDTILSGMNLGQAKFYPKNWSLVSWRSQEDSAVGSFSLDVNIEGELVIKEGSKTYWTGSPFLFENYSVDVLLHQVQNRAMRKSHPGDNYITWHFLDPSTIMHIVLDMFGKLKLQSWSEDDQSWRTLKFSKCSYRRCGAYSICNIIAEKPCSCLTGFKPFSAENWTKNETSQGCVRKTHLHCSNSTTGGGFNNYGFYWMTFVDFPSGRSVLEYVSSAVECEAVCLSNCSCLAYSYDLKCLQWYGDLFDLKQLAINDSDGKNFYLKLPISELTKDPISSTSRRTDDQNAGTKMQMWIIVILTISLLMFILGLCIHYVRRKLHGQGGDLLKFDLAMSLKADHTELTEENMRSARKKPEVKLPLFSFASVSAATNGFSSTNKLGEGGFGPVYKGILLKGDEIAVKRLSKRSGQGWEELKNEALVIAKLQHKNLVRLLGCCIEKDEKIIIYEFMPNKSLDFFLFDSVRRRILDWEIRVRIIEGIAQGLLYLHQYSRVRIIHRDLKASNILLDNNMNPKISDFGMAKIFGGDELQANTNRIVGTYGYMSPEYALEGLFSIKSDVFSFGVLLLEILSGKKNTGFYQSNSLHLLGHAWDLWISNKGSELIDPVLEEVSTHLAMRYINIGLLCVQERADDRPTMSDVVSMLDNESLILLSPKQPAFLNVRSIANLPLVKSRQEICSVNDVTFSAFQTR